MPNIFEVAEQESPTLTFMAKGGKGHVYESHPRLRGLTRAMCGARPPVFGGEWLGMERIMPLKAFASTEGHVPGSWANLKRLIALLSCDTCHRMMVRTVNEVWKSNGLNRYLPEDEFPLRA